MFLLFFLLLGLVCLSYKLNAAPVSCIYKELLLPIKLSIL